MLHVRALIGISHKVRLVLHGWRRDIVRELVLFDEILHAGERQILSEIVRRGIHYSIVVWPLLRLGSLASG